MCHSGEGRNPFATELIGIPAFAGMTGNNYVSSTKENVSKFFMEFFMLLHLILRSSFPWYNF